MSFEIKVNDNISEIKVLNREGNMLEIAVGERIYNVDIIEVEKGVYSLLLDGTSFNIELSRKGLKRYDVNTLYNSFDIEIIDAEAKYMNSRKSEEDRDADFISTPMPGKIVKILVKEGDIVKGGDTVVIVSAMKMESEYKVVKDRIIKQILVKEGDNIDGHQPLIMLEEYIEE
jgi:acetyl/propionyl-CoA carboxylase alpha subunit